MVDTRNSDCEKEISHSKLYIGSFIKAIWFYLFQPCVCLCSVHTVNADADGNFSMRRDVYRQFRCMQRLTAMARAIGSVLSNFETELINKCEYRAPHRNARPPAIQMKHNVCVACVPRRR